MLESGIFKQSTVTAFSVSMVGKSLAGRFVASSKTKHVHLRFLYMQELVCSGLVRLRKVLGTLNPADVLTKHVGRETLARHLPTLGFPL